MYVCMYVDVRIFTPSGSFVGDYEGTSIERFTEAGMHE